ncbi:MAG: hypothetical protein HGB32_06100 [Geobacteraceae bacterium]|nr:hypothetical protein [Geobacteraceae bacterium]NTW79704.1 hypothetical protein [Geobacteraceae bacterium]
MCEAGMSFVPIAEAAQLLETTEMRVLMMLKKNELQGKMVDEAWYVDRSSLQLCEKPKAADIVKAGGCGGGCGGNSSGCGGH